MTRYFTLQEAESMLPMVRDSLESAIEAKGQIESIDAEIQDLASRIAIFGGIEINPDHVARRKLERVSLVRAVEEAVNRIQRSGCLVKDLDMGLLDFPALLNGVEVYLCWRLGEPKIEWWHSVQEGYSGRRRILDEFGYEEPNLRPN